MPDLVGAIRSGDADAVGRIADFWNTGWRLEPGDLELAKFPSSGPYRIESYTTDDGLVLVENERWWGIKPQTSRIVLWPKGSDVQAGMDAGTSKSWTSVPVRWPGSSRTADSTSHTSRRAVWSSSCSRRRVCFGSPDARRAFALCLPRQRLYDELGHPGFDRADGIGSGVIDSRITGPDTLFTRRRSPRKAARTPTPTSPERARPPVSSN
ncbi:hypothetical protein GS934_07025 [Rhodococcus hoagii]|nr:hypothetical protein [Prescottella equi]NKZ87381.1 hypothetical protein [Prescottella equi]